MIAAAKPRRNGTIGKRWVRRRSRELEGTRRRVSLIVLLTNTAAGFPRVVPDIAPELANFSFPFARGFPFVLALVVGNDKFSVAMRRQQLFKAAT